MVANEQLVELDMGMKWRKVLGGAELHRSKYVLQALAVDMCCLDARTESSLWQVRPLKQHFCIDLILMLKCRYLCWLLPAKKNVPMCSRIKWSTRNSSCHLVPGAVAPALPWRSSWSIQNLPIHSHTSQAKSGTKSWVIIWMNYMIYSYYVVYVCVSLSISFPRFTIRLVWKIHSSFLGCPFLECCKHGCFIECMRGAFPLTT